MDELIQVSRANFEAQGEALDSAHRQIDKLTRDNVRLTEYMKLTEKRRQFADRKLKHVCEQRDALAARVAELEALLHTVCHERDDIEDARMMGLSTIGKLVALLRSGAGEDSHEYQRALEIIGAPPAGDVNAPDFSTEVGWLRHIKRCADDLVNAIESPMETWGNEEHPAWQAYWSLAISMGEFESYQKDGYALPKDDHERGGLDPMSAKG